MKKTEFMEQGNKLFGENFDDWVFVCPVCNKEQSNNDFKKIGIDAREKGYIAFSCIGRFIEGSKDALGSKGGKAEKGCNYTNGGLFKLAKKEVYDEEHSMHVFLFKGE